MYSHVHEIVDDVRDQTSAAFRRVQFQDGNTRVLFYFLAQDPGCLYFFFFFFLYFSVSLRFPEKRTAPVQCTLAVLIAIAGLQDAQAGCGART